MSEPVFTILILDDDEAVRESVRDFFEDRGWRVHAAATAEEALALLKHAAIDGAVVDIRLPGMDGNAWVRVVSERHPMLACVICTGSPEYHLPGDVTGLVQVSERVFFKPVADLGELARAVRDQIEKLRGHPGDRPAERRAGEQPGRNSQHEGSNHE